MIKKNIWIIGTGFMAIEYAKVLKSLQCNFIVIGRGHDNCKLFNELFEIKTIEGGLDLFLKSNPEIPEAVINTVGIESLTSTTQRLLEFGVKYILLEKPGFGNPKELEGTVLLSIKNNATILIAYNRRFYQSVLKAITLIKNDGGVKSFNFEFTEWSHAIELLDKTNIEHKNWFYGNSTHLIDLAFYLGGIPKSISCYKSGKLNWHPAGSIYAGSGETENGAIFSYIANWQSPGRWNLELCTKNLRLIFKPLEKLQIMINGSINVINDEEINYDLDQKFKPGLYLQLKNFLEINTSSFITINEQYNRLNIIYSKINF